MEPRLNSGN